MEENKNKNKVNDAESYDFMADAMATIKGLIDRSKEHGLFERKDDERALVCMAIDIDGEKILFTAHGMAHVVVAGISANIVESGLAEKVKKAIDMYESRELNFRRKEAEYENAEEVQDAEPAEEPGGDE